MLYSIVQMIHGISLTSSTHCRFVCVRVCASIYSILTFWCCTLTMYIHRWSEFGVVIQQQSTKKTMSTIHFWHWKRSCRRISVGRFLYRTRLLAKIIVKCRFGFFLMPFSPEHFGQHRPLAECDACVWLVVCACVFHFPIV